MAVEENGHMPLYMHVVLTILADLGSNYTFTRFRDAIKKADFDMFQRKSLELRLQLLHACREAYGRFPLQPSEPASSVRRCLPP
jgi:hypothetical protein